jgi:hypothetical protein
MPEELRISYASPRQDFESVEGKRGWLRGLQLECGIAVLFSQISILGLLHPQHDCRRSAKVFGEAFGPAR